MLDKAQLNRGIQFLAGQGLNLYAVFDCTTLPHSIIHTTATENIPWREYTRLMLLGNAGTRLWPALTTFGMKTADPVDYFSLEVTRNFINNFLDGPPTLILYPQAYNVPLQQLGELAGWHHPSPLGIGINQTYGLWFAYRTTFLISAPLPLTEKQNTPSPCDSCREKPCLSACPARAVGDIGGFNIPACFAFRVQKNSVCQDRCLARMACPIAPEHRYPLEQIKYHYLHALTTARRYAS